MYNKMYMRRAHFAVPNCRRGDSPHTSLRHRVALCAGAIAFQCLDPRIGEKGTGYIGTYNFTKKK